MFVMFQQAAVKSHLAILKQYIDFSIPERSECSMALRIRGESGMKMMPNVSKPEVPGAIFWTPTARIACLQRCLGSTFAHC